MGCATLKRLCKIIFPTFGRKMESGFDFVTEACRQAVKFGEEVWSSVFLTWVAHK